MASPNLTPGVLSRAAPPWHTYAMKSPRRTYRQTFIRQWREHAGMTVDELGEAIEMSGASVSRIENGKQPYTQPVIEKIADALGASVSSLLEFDPKTGRSIYDLAARATPEQQAQIVRVAEAMLGFIAKN